MTYGSGQDKSFHICLQRRKRGRGGTVKIYNFYYFVDVCKQRELNIVNIYG